MIKRHTLYGFSVVVNPKRQLIQHDPRIPDAYTLCVHVALMNFVMRGIKPGDKVRLFFERGHKHRAKAEKYLQTAEMPSAWSGHQFEHKGKVRLLEAADLLAWQTTKFIKDKVYSSRKPRGDFVSLMEHPHRFVYLDFSGERRYASEDLDPKKDNEKRDRMFRALFGGGASGNDVELRKSYDSYRYIATKDGIKPK